MLALSAAGAADGPPQKAYPTQVGETQTGPAETGIPAKSAGTVQCVPPHDGPLIIRLYKMLFADGLV